VDDVTHHVNRRVFPINELAVAPDTVVVIYRGKQEDTGPTLQFATALAFLA
jgi:hypothetical protein